MIFMENMPAILGGRYNSKTKPIDIDVQYGGGCEEHKFQLKIDLCRQSSPVQCDAKLIDLKTDDHCEALIYDKISVSLHETGLDNDNYTGASINIQGTGNSKILIILPVFKNIFRWLNYYFYLFFSRF